MTTTEAGVLAVVKRPGLPVGRLLDLREFLDGLVIALPSESHVRPADGTTVRA
jgi:hypothetical protein